MARGTIATVQEDLDVTSDHLPLLAIVHCGVRSKANKKGLRHATINKDVFLSLLLSQLDGVLPIADKSIAEIDGRAE